MAQRRKGREGDALVLWHFFASLRLCAFALKILLIEFLPTRAGKSNVSHCPHVGGAAIGTLAFRANDNEVCGRRRIHNKGY